ncbi:hypothetical protein PAC01_18630 [Pediococcus acidilactici]|nr:hypothetical protein PAC01_18630 [Pediococcus acidilactici]
MIFELVFDSIVAELSALTDMVATPAKARKTPNAKKIFDQNFLDNYNIPFISTIG